MLFKEHYSAYIDLRMLENDLAPNTVRHYYEISKNYLMPAFGDREISTIKRNDILTWRALTLKEGRCKERYMKQIMILLKAVMRNAFLNGDIKINPCADIKQVPVKDTDHEPWTREQIKKAIAELEPQYAAFFTAFASTGARPYELLALKWSAVDLNDQEEGIHICLGRSRNIESTKLKTDSSVRDLPMPESLGQLLATTPRISEYVFCNPDGSPLQERTLQKAWKRACLKAGIPARRPYLLRHSLATYLLSTSGGDAPMVAAQLGHSGVENVLKVYGRPQANPTKVIELLDKEAI